MARPRQSAGICQEDSRLPHRNIDAFLVAALGLHALTRLSLLFFARFGVGSIVAFQPCSG
jgi:hypothetical protein